MPKELISLERKKLQFREYEDRELQDDEILVKYDYAACKHGTELSHFNGVDPFKEWNFDSENGIFTKKEGIIDNKHFMRPGNMFVGKIIKMGKDVNVFETGERVAGYGPFRETTILKADRALKMNDRMDWKEAVCYDPAQFALGGIRDGHVRMGDKVVVFGLGAIGLMAVQMAKKSGASLVIAIDPIDKRRAVAAKTGADLVIDPIKEDAGLLIKKEVRGGVDAAIETSGTYSALQHSIRGLAYGGNVAVVGWYKECKGYLNLGMEAHFNHPNIILSRACSEPNRDYPRWSFQRIRDNCWEMLSKGMFDCSEIVDPVVAFDDLEQTYMDISENPENSVKLGVDFSL